MARRKPELDPPSHDSFLDIVANLVGILIILIMVVGIQAKSALVTASIASKKKVEAKQPDVATPKKVSKGLATNLHAVEKQIREHRFHVQFREAERNKTLTLITQIKQAMEKERQALDSGQQSKFDQRRQLIHRQSQLDELQQQRMALDNAKAPIVKLAHLPTPKARTVFGREVHFRLLQGRLCFVPLKALVDKMKSQLPEKFQQLRRMSVLHEVIGPIDGFKMTYTLSVAVAARRTKFGTQARKVGQFTKAELVPVRQNMGEPLDRALASGSEFDDRLRLLNPQTTITVWVYPDSYSDFRKLKEQLFRRGFLTAARPLPKNQKIGLSPSGSRSSAQ